MVGSDLEKIIWIFDLNIKGRSGYNFDIFFGQTGLIVQMESALGPQFVLSLSIGMEQIQNRCQLDGVCFFYQAAALLGNWIRRRDNLVLDQSSTLPTETP